MSYERYRFLAESFQQGYKVDLGKLIIINKFGRQLSITKHNKRTPVVSIRSRQYSVTEVIGAWMGMDVIDNWCFFKDGNTQNYHPGNLIWTTREAGNVWLNLMNPPRAKLTRGMVNFIKSFTIEGSGLKLRDLADMYGVSYHTIIDIRTKSKGMWREARKPTEKIL
jgi:hypothetical protein